MSVAFREIDPLELDFNAFSLIGEEWMLITAGRKEDFNTMTASWGSIGVLWNLPVAFCFIRPHRHTFGFAESAPYFTLSFLRPGNRKILQFCGSNSGRDTDKIRETGLVPLTTGRGNVFYEQCRLALECRKLYSDWIRENEFLVKDLIGRNYPAKDFHKFYIGEIIRCLVPE